MSKPQPLHHTYPKSFQDFLEKRRGESTDAFVNRLYTMELILYVDALQQAQQVFSMYENSALASTVDPAIKQFWSGLNQNWGTVDVQLTHLGTREYGQPLSGALGDLVLESKAETSGKDINTTIYENIVRARDHVYFIEKALTSARASQMDPLLSTQLTQLASLIQPSLHVITAVPPASSATSKAFYYFYF